MTCSVSDRRKRDSAQAGLGASGIRRKRDSATSSSKSPLTSDTPGSAASCATHRARCLYSEHAQCSGGPLAAAHAAECGWHNARGPCGIPCCVGCRAVRGSVLSVMPGRRRYGVGYHAGWDTMPGGIPCRVGHVTSFAASLSVLRNSAFTSTLPPAERSRTTARRPIPSARRSVRGSLASARCADACYARRVACRVSHSIRGARRVLAGYSPWLPVLADADATRIVSLPCAQPPGAAHVCDERHCGRVRMWQG